jgi:hypothetical protein
MFIRGPQGGEGDRVLILSAYPVVRKHNASGEHECTGEE